jgi:hypothetical protein
LSKEASTALHRVSHWVGPTSAIPKVSCPEHGSTSLNSSTTLLWVGSDSLSQLANTQPVSQTSLISNLTNPPNSSYFSLLYITKTNKTLPRQLHCKIHSLLSNLNPELI